MIAQAAWPDSEGSVHVRSFFDAVGSDSKERIRTLVENHYAPGATGCMDEEIESHRAIRRQLGAFDIQKVEQSAPAALSVWGWAQRLGTWMRFDFELETTPPYRIRRADGHVSFPPGQDLPVLSSDMELEEMVGKTRAAVCAPALAVAVYRQSALVVRVAVGVRRIDSNDAVSIDDCFHLGSITKSMTATAIAGLVESGVLSWASRLEDVVDGLDMRADYRQVTLTDLLHHRGGIAPFTNDDEYPAVAIASTRSSAQTRRRAVAAAALQCEPVCPPGSAMIYSNAGYVIAALMAEAASGHTWEQIMREQLFEPWGLRSCGFGWPTTRACSNQPHGHFGLPERYQLQHPGDYETVANLRGATDVHCSVTDLARFGVHHLDGLRGRNATLSSETITWLHTPAVDGNANPSYAAGWGIATLDDGSRHDYHYGTNGTYFARLSLFPDKDLVVAVVTNCGVHAQLGIDTLVSAIVAKWE